MLIGPIQSQSKWGFLDESGNWAIPPKYESAGEFHEGLAAFSERGKLGFIDELGRVTIEPRFPSDAGAAIWGFRNGLAPIEGNTCYIDREGELALKLDAGDQGWHFLSGRAVCMDEQGTYSVIDPSGKAVSSLPIFEAPYLPDWPRCWECFTCWFKTDRLSAGALDWRGNILFEPKYEDLGTFYLGVAPFSPGEDNRAYGLVKFNGEIALDPTLFKIDEFCEGLASAAEKKDTWGFISPEGDWVIEPKYRQVKPFSGGLACVTTGLSARRGKKGYVNSKGELVIEPHFDHASSFRRGYAQVEYEQNRAVIDQTGRVVWAERIAL